MSAVTRRRVLVLREVSDARRTASELRRRGHDPLVVPLAHIQPLRTPCPPGPFGAVLATSAQAVRWLSDRRARIGDVPAFAVGARTATALADAGWRVAAQGSEGAADLLDRLAAAVADPARPLLYAAGRVRLAGTQDGLAARGIPFVLAEVYDTLAREPDAGEIAGLGASRIDAALLLSVLQADGFLRLRERHAAPFAAGEPRLLCLSERIAERLPSALRDLAVWPAAPRLADLLDRLDENGEGSAEDFRCSGGERL